MYADAAEKADEVTSFMNSFLKRGVKNFVSSSSMFVNSRLNLVSMRNWYEKSLT